MERKREPSALFLKHLPLVDWGVSIAARRGWPIPRDDARQAALLGLHQACVTAPTHPTFEAYAKTRIKGAVVDEARRYGMPRKGRAPIRDELTELVSGAIAAEILPRAIHVEGETFEVISLGDSIEQRAEQGERHERLWRLLARPGRNRTILRRVLSGEPQSDVARAYGMSAPRVNQICTELVSRLHEDLKTHVPAARPTQASTANRRRPHRRKGG